MASSSSGRSAKGFKYSLTDMRSTRVGYEEVIKRCIDSINFEGYSHKGEIINRKETVTMPAGFLDGQSDAKLCYLYSFLEHHFYIYSRSIHPNVEFFQKLINLLHSNRGNDKDVEAMFTILNHLMEQSKKDSITRYSYFKSMDEILRHPNLFEVCKNLDGSLQELLERTNKTIDDSDHRVADASSALSWSNYKNKISRERIDQFKEIINLAALNNLEISFIEPPKPIHGNMLLFDTAIIINESKATSASPKRPGISGSAAS